MDIDMSIDQENSEKHALMTCTQNMIIMTNFSFDIDEHKLLAAIKKRARIIWFKFMTSPDEYALAYAYTKFETPQCVENVMQNLKAINAEIGEQIVAMVSRISALTNFVYGGKLLVTGIGKSVNDDTISKVFGNLGHCYEIQRISPTSILVSYQCEYYARNAQIQMSGTELGGSTIIVYYFDRRARMPDYNVRRMVFRPYNLKPDVDSQQLTNQFSFLGQFNARVYRNADGSSRCHGHVFFDEPPADCPLMCMFAKQSIVSGKFKLKQNAGNVRGSLPIMPRCSVDPTYSRVHPQAVPTLLGKYYRKPEEARPEHTGDDVQLYESLDEAEFIKRTLSAYPIHVTNLGDYTVDTLTERFARYGEILHVIFHDDCTYFALVLFKNYREARIAVDQIKYLKEQGKTDLSVELVDSYQVHNFDREQGAAKRIILEPFFRPGNDGMRFPIYRDRVYHVESSGAVKSFPLTELTDAWTKRFSEELKQEEERLKNHKKPGADREKCRLSVEQLKKTIAKSESFSAQRKGAMTMPKMVENMEKPQEFYRARMAEQLAKLFQKSSNVDQKALLEMGMRLTVVELNTIMGNEKEFRMYFMKKAVESAKNKKN